MKKRVAIPIIVTASVVAAVFVAVLVLSLITVNPLKTIIGDDYVSIAVYDPGTTTPYPEEAVKDGEKLSDKVKAGIDASGFSVMHGMLEGRFTYSPKFKTEKNDEGKSERVSCGFTELLLLYPESEGETYMLEVRYDDEHTMTVQGEEVKYDRLKIFVYETNGEIERMDVYAYSFAAISTNNDDRAEYSIDVIQIWVNTSSLMDVVTDMESLL